VAHKPSDGSGVVPLYFAFPDGVYHYVCAACTALCCRGQGFAGNLQREMRQLLSIYPALGSAATARQGNILSFATPSGRCHFLDGDNLCRIEKEHGKALKPGVCALFPFNVFTRIGTVVAVSPHFMCPLRLQVPAQPGQVEGTHARLEAAVRESALLERADVEAHLVRARLHPALDADSVLARETLFRDACSLALGQRRFMEVLRAHAADAPGLDAFLERATRILGLEHAARSGAADAVDDLCLALAAPLRLRLLHLSSEGMLRVLALSEIVLRRTLTLSDQPPTLQGAYQMITSVGPALRLLARGDEPVELGRRASAKAPPFGDPDLTFAAFLALRAVHNSTGVLQALEQAMQPSFSAADRSVLLIQLGSKLEHGTPVHRRTRSAAGKRGDGAGLLDRRTE
jgi:hypothetical protein